MFLKALSLGLFAFNLSFFSGAFASVKPVQSVEQCQWSYSETGIDWALENIAKPGLGVTIGQLDTGYLPSPFFEIGEHVSAGLYLPLPRVGSVLPVLNWVEVGRPPLDYPGAALSLWGHGVSIEGVLLNQKSRGALLGGIVPFARVIPYRISPFVVSGTAAGSPPFSPSSNVARALRNAIEQGVDVVNLSFGALFDTNGPQLGSPASGGIGISWPLNEVGEIQSAFEAAGRAGVIVVVAGGQGSPINVLPASAAGPHVLPIGGSIRGQKPWPLALKLAQIVASAPAEDVCYARPAKEQWDGDFDEAGQIEVSKSFVWQLGAGTSFATAYTSGIAALWIQAHPEIPKKERPEAFRAALLDHGTFVPAGWPAKGYGKGIVNVRLLLEHDLAK